MAFADNLGNTAVRRHWLCYFEVAIEIDTLLIDGTTSGASEYRIGTVWDKLDIQSVYSLDTSNDFKRSVTQRTSSIDGTGTNGYYYNEVTGDFEFGYDSSGESFDDQLMVLCRYYMTDGPQVKYYSDPQDASSDLVTYRSLITEDMVVEKSIEGVLNGIADSTASSLVLANASDILDPLLFSSVSVLNQKFYLFMYIDGNLDDNRQIFRGLGNSIQADKQQIRISTRDVFSYFDRIAYFDLDPGSFYNTIEYTNSSGQPASLAEPIMLGDISPYGVDYVYYSGAATDYFNLNSNSWELYAFNYDDVQASSSDPRYGNVWAPGDFADVAYTITTTANTASFPYHRLTTSASDEPIFHIGDQLRNGTAGTYGYAYVVAINPILNYVYVFTQNAGFATNLGGSNDVEILKYTIYGEDSTGAFVAPLTPEADYTAVGNDVGASYLNTSFTAWIFDLTYANLAGTFGSSDPADWRIFVRWRNSESYVNHGDLLQWMFDTWVDQDFGQLFTTDTTTFSAAISGLDLNISTTIPFGLGSTYPTYREIIEKIIKTTMGYLYVNSDDEIAYELFSAPSSTDVRDSRHIIKDSESLDHDFEDSYSQITIVNSEILTGEQNQPTVGGTAPFASVDSTLAGVYTDNIIFAMKSDSSQHNHYNTTVFDQASTRINNNFVNLMGVFNNRSRIYKFKTAHIDLDTELGDDILYKGSLLSTFEQSSGLQLKVIGLRIDGSGVEITATDLKGVT